MPTARVTGSDIPLPPMELRLMRDTDERFVSQGVELGELLFRLGLRKHDRLLDVGCSVGRLPVGLAAGTDFAGEYAGFDVMRKQVDWAHKVLQPALPRTRFKYVDVRNDRYNPSGTVAPERLRFPAGSDRFDMACLFSIFTHFYADDIRLYLRELRRVLRPGGTVVASWFLFNDARREAAVNSSVYPMQHRLDDVTIYNDEADPLRAIAFHEKFVKSAIADAELDIVAIEHGKWAGGPGPHFQDLVVLRRPELPVPDRQLAALRRRLRPLKARVRH